MGVTFGNVFAESTADVTEKTVYTVIDHYGNQHDFKNGYVADMLSFTEHVLLGVENDVYSHTEAHRLFQEFAAFYDAKYFGDVCEPN